MFLTVENVHHYLLARGLLNPEDVVRGGLTIQDSGRRNRNFKIHLENRAGLFVKQVPGVFTETVSSVYREALCYDLAETDPAFASLRPFVAKLYDYDPRIHAIISELIPECENLNQLHVQLAYFPPNIGTALGRALGTIHGAAGQMLANVDNLKAFPRMQPWVLTIAQNAESVFSNMSEGMRQLVGLIRQNMVLVTGLQGLSAGWRYEAFIHGDIKWDNFLLNKSRVESDIEPELRIIDWELSDVGDPGWDIGCAFGAYLQHWLVSLMADTSQQDTTTLILNAPHKLDSLWPAIHSLWKAYTEARGLNENEASLELYRVAAFTAGRLVLTAFEIINRMPQVSRSAVLCLDLATMMFTYPQRAMYEVLGFVQTVSPQVNTVGQPITRELT